MIESAGESSKESKCQIWPTREADVIFSSLPEPSDVEAVAIGGDGLIAGIKPGAAYFDLSTNSPSVVKKLNAVFAEKGSHMLDAPVSGGPAGAASHVEDGS
jgi:3-hydroxyisobutyrate dehydrogenase